MSVDDHSLVISPARPQGPWFGSGGLHAGAGVGRLGRAPVERRTEMAEYHVKTSENGEVQGPFSGRNLS